MIISQRDVAIFADEVVRELDGAIDELAGLRHLPRVARALDGLCALERAMIELRLWVDDPQ